MHHTILGPQAWQHQGGWKCGRWEVDADIGGLSESGRMDVMRQVCSLWLTFYDLEQDIGGRRYLY